MAFFEPLHPKVYKTLICLFLHYAFVGKSTGFSPVELFSCCNETLRLITELVDEVWGAALLPENKILRSV